MSHTNVAQMIALDWDQQVLCAHCGLEVLSSQPSEDPQFCCSGCSVAYALLHDKQLDAYYGLSERRKHAVTSSGRSFEEFDHPAFEELHVSEVGGGLSRVELIIEGIHCASCVWLVERVPLLLNGVVSAVLDVGRSLVTLEWDRRALPLSSVARTLDSLGYTPHAYRAGTREQVARKNERSALVRVGVSGAIAANVMLAALAMYSGALGPGLEAEYERFFRWLSLGLVVPALVWPGNVFFRGAWAAIRTRTLHLDLPIAIALAAGFLRGALNTVSGQGPVYLDGIAVLVFLLLVGRYLQQKWQRAATDASELLSALTPRSARLVDEGAESREVPVGALLPGMVVEVRPGDTFPADGVALGNSAVNRSWLTGESNHVSIAAGDAVHAGTINLTAAVRVKVTKAGEETRVAELMRQVQETTERRAPVVLIANRMAGVFVGVTFILAVVTWLIGRRIDPGGALDNAIALLIVTCPCALAMATPLTVTVALGRAARQGIFVRGGDVLQLLSTSGRLFLDKTGTLTRGHGELVSWEGPDWVRPLVLGAEDGSVHPIARAFQTAWPQVAFTQASNATHTHGSGIIATVDGRCVVVGSPSFVAAHTTESSVPSTDVSNDLTPVHVAVDGVLAAVAGIGDRVRDEAPNAIAQLRRRGWHPTILSGDRTGVALEVASRVGIALDDVVGDASPEDKLQTVQRASAGGTVVMAGDGVNDAAAMAAASVGIAVHGGAEAALATADVFFTRQGLDPLVDLVEGSRRTMGVIRRNIGFSLAYNVLGVGLAMSGLISPLVAAVMMPASSLTVVAGAWFSRTFSTLK